MRKSATKKSNSIALTNSNRENGEKKMTSYVKTVKKSVEDMLKPAVKGKKPKVKKSCKIAVPLASAATVESNGRFKVSEFVTPEQASENMLALCGGDVLTAAKWFDFGRIAYARVLAMNALLGLSGDENKDLRKNIKDFVAKLETLKDVMEMSEKDAIAKLSTKESYKPVIAYFEELAKGETMVSFDFANVELKEPRWFGGEEEGESEEEEEGESEEK